MSSISNAELIPIYTDWANRHLSKVATTSSFKQIRDISNDFRDYRLVSQLINVIVPINDHTTHFNKTLARTTSNLDGLESCLDYLRTIGLDCTKLTKTDIDSGNLGAVLQLLYLLSTFKQKLRQLKKDQKYQQQQQYSQIMPPNLTKLPSPQQRLTSGQNSNFLNGQHQTMSSTGSRLQPPSRIAKPASSTTDVSKASTNSLISKPKNSSLIRAPGNSSSSSATSNIRPLSRSSGNNNVKTSLDSSSSCSSIPPAPSSSSRPGIPKPKTAKLSKIAPPTTHRNPTVTPTAAKTAAVKQIGGISSTSSRKEEEKGSMLKLNLFKDKSKANSLATPKIMKKVESSKIGTTGTIQTTPRSGLKPPTGPSRIGQATSMSKLNTPRVNYRTPTANQSITDAKDPKRCSKSSEEESGYAGFSSTSPASTSSTEGSLSMHSASSKSSDNENSPSSDDVTLNSSIVTTIRQPVKVSSEEKPILAVKGVAKEDCVKNTAVVSPMLTHRKLVEEKPTMEKVAPASQKPPASASNPSSGSLSTPSSSSPNSPDSSVPPKMAPIRHPPTYEQLLKQGRITSPVEEEKEKEKEAGFISSKNSEESLNTVRMAPPMGKARASGSVIETPSHSLERRGVMAKSKNSESSGYTSEGGYAAVTKMREKMREYHECAREMDERQDNFEDSSSLSSGISDNIEFDDISTSDLSGVDMTTVAKHSDYSHFVRPSTKSRSVSSHRPSQNIESRSRTMMEQENVHKLLSQCRTSQRGLGAATTQPQYSLKSPGYATFQQQHLTVSADKDTMSMHSQTARRPSSSASHKPVYGGSGFHSLDRKCHLQEFSTDHRMAALLSPRRVPNPPACPSSLSSSGMSRSMILLESLSPRSSPRRAHHTAQHQMEQPNGTRRSHSPRAPSSARYPLSLAASPAHKVRTTGYGDAFQLYRLSDDPISSQKARSEMGSQLSLASTTAYASLSEKYESAIRGMTRELEGQRSTVDNLKRKQENYGMLHEMFEQKLRKLTQHIERSNLKAEEAMKFKQDIAHLREISAHMAANSPHIKDGAGELLRQPSLESVASHRSSMSSSSKSSKQEKMSLNSFGKPKKSWALSVDSQIRSSLSKFTKKKGAKSEILENAPTAVDDVLELRQELRQRDTVLTEVRLDALDRAREVDVLKEAVHKLKHENKQLKKKVDQLTNIGPSRASSQASLPFATNIYDEEPVYDAACTSSNSSGSKRSSGCNSIKVTVNVDLTGEISSIVNPDNEIIVGYLAMPTNQSTWTEIDTTILSLFENYLHRIDIENQIDINPSDAILGYQIGDVRRFLNEKIHPLKPPFDVIQPTTTIRMFMNGAVQNRVDSLVLDTLLPRQMILQLVKYVTTQRRLVLAGAAGIGKSKLAKSLAVYVSMKNQLSSDDIIDVKIPDEGTEELLKVERHLEKILQSKKSCIILLDNIPKNRVAFVGSLFGNLSLKNDEGPFVICTVNRYKIPEMNFNQNFKMFLLTNRMEGVNGFMLRFLRRRIIEAEYRQLRQTPSEMVQIIQFLPIVLQSVNQFLEKTNSVEVSIGPRVFLQCPFSIEESRKWFVHLWNINLIPYMEKAAREGKKMFGRCTTFDDPTDQICEKWPWMDGANPEDILKKLSLQDLAPTPSKLQFNPLESLIQLHCTKSSAIDNI